MKRSGLSLLIILGVIAVAGAQPTSALWPMWSTFDSGSAIVVDHGIWDRFLSAYVIPDDPSGVNLIDYGAVSDEDKSILDRYVAALETVTVTDLDRTEQLAYWINLYNALTVRTSSWPTGSICTTR